MLSEIADIIISYADLAVKRRIQLVCRRTSRKMPRIEYNPFVAASKGDTFSLSHMAVIFGAPSGEYALRKFFAHVIQGQARSMFFLYASKATIEWMMRKKYTNIEDIRSRIPKQPSVLAFSRYNKARWSVEEVAEELLSNLYIHFNSGDAMKYFRYGPIKKGAGHQGFVEIYSRVKRPKHAAGTFKGHISRIASDDEILRIIQSDLLEENIGVYLSFKYAYEITQIPHKYTREYMSKEELFKRIADVKKKEQERKDWLDKKWEEKKRAGHIPSWQR